MTSPPPQSASALPKATLVREVADEARRYDMFALCALSKEGATLTGMLLLEMDEVFKLELAFDDGERVRVDARVTQLLRELPGMEVVFVGLDETRKKRIACRATGAA